MSKILNPVQIVASALAMRVAPSEPAPSEPEEPPERRPAPRSAQPTRRPRKSAR